MNFLLDAQWRYATKTYDPSKNLNPEDVERLKEILRLSPSSIDSQPWQFLFVQDPHIRGQLAENSMYNEERIKQAPLLIVFTVPMDLAQFEKQNIDTLDDRTKEYYQHFKGEYGDAVVKDWMSRQVYIALGFCLAACANMRLDSTPMEGIDPVAYQKILKISDYRPLFAVSVGYRDSGDYNQPSLSPKRRLPLSDVVKDI